VDNARLYRDKRNHSVSVLYLRKLVRSMLWSRHCKGFLDRRTVNVSW